MSVEMQRAYIEDSRDTVTIADQAIEDGAIDAEFTIQDTGEVVEIGDSTEKQADVQTV